MVGVTEEECNKIRKGKTIIVEKEENKFKILPENIYCFGKIDFTDGSEDMDQLDDFNWLNQLITRGVCIPADYDYETHCCFSPRKTYRWYDTFSTALVCQYKHAVLGKPENVCIFKYVK